MCFWLGPKVCARPCPIFRCVRPGVYKLGEGASVKGRLLKDGKPLAGIEVGISGSNRRSDIYVKKGSGPSGIVLKPDGSPATEVAAYLTDMRNGVYVQDATLKVREESYRDTAKTMTDDKGHFSFPARIDSYAVIILDEAGFAQVRVNDLEERSEIHLQPWSRVEGKLLIGDKPAANQSVHLWPAHLPYEDQSDPRRQGASRHRPHCALRL